MCWQPLEAYLHTTGDQLVCRGHDLAHALAESDPMEESAALESLQMTMADGRV